MLQGTLARLEQGVFPELLGLGIEIAPVAHPTPQLGIDSNRSDRVQDRRLACQSRARFVYVSLGGEELSYCVDIPLAGLSLLFFLYAIWKVFKDRLDSRVVSGLQGGDQLEVAQAQRTEVVSHSVQFIPSLFTCKILVSAVLACSGSCDMGARMVCGIGRPTEIVRERDDGRILPPHAVEDSISGDVARCDAHAVY